jgi:hypothetical protein
MWLVIKRNRYLDASGRFTRNVLLARRFRRKCDALDAAGKFGGQVFRETDFDAYPE